MNLGGMTWQEVMENDPQEERGIVGAVRARMLIVTGSLFSIWESWSGFSSKLHA
jgi:hypothetical protein